MTHDAKIDQQRQKLSQKVVGKMAPGVKCNCGQYHFVGGKITGLRFLGESGFASSIDPSFWNPLDPMAWEVEITPEQDGSKDRQVWHAGLSHVMSDFEIISLFQVLN